MAKDPFAEFVEADSSVDPFAEFAEQPTAPTAIPPTAVHQAALARLPQMFLDALPGFLGGAGGMVPGPPGIGLSALLGGAGAAIRQGAMGNLAPPGPGMTPINPAALLEIGRSAGEQGAYSAIPFGLGRAGSNLMARAVRPGALVNQFPDVVQTLMRERLPATAQGLEKAGGLRKASAGTTQGLLAGATAAGQTFQASDLTGQVVAAIRQTRYKPLPKGERTAMMKMLGEFLQAHQGALTPETLKLIKREAQAEAAPVFKALASPEGAAVPPNMAARARFNRLIANEAQKALETIKGMAASEKRTQSLIGAQRALRKVDLRKAAGQDVGVSMAEAIPGAPSALKALLPRVTTGAASNTALALNAPLLHLLLANLPRAGSALLFPDLFPPDTTEVSR